MVDFFKVRIMSPKGGTWTKATPREGPVPWHRSEQEITDIDPKHPYEKTWVWDPACL